jgi:biotin carboxyl carrier protein
MVEKRHAGGFVIEAMKMETTIRTHLKIRSQHTHSGWRTGYGDLIIELKSL